MSAFHPTCLNIETRWCSTCVRKWNNYEISHPIMKLQQDWVNGHQQKKIFILQAIRPKSNGANCKEGATIRWKLPCHREFARVRIEEWKLRLLLLDYLHGIFRNLQVLYPLFHFLGYRHLIFLLDSQLLLYHFQLNFCLWRLTEIIITEPFVFFLGLYITTVLAKLGA